MSYKEFLLDVDRLTRLPSNELQRAPMPAYLSDPLLKSRLYSMMKNPAGVLFINKHELWPDANNPIEAVPFLQMLVRFRDENLDITVEAVARMICTNEPRVQMGILELLAQLHASHSVQFLSQIGKWPKNSRTVFLYEGVAKLIANLATSGTANAAIEFTSHCLAFSKTPSSMDPTQRVRPMWDVHEFERILDVGVRRLGEVEPFRTFYVCCDTLNSALELASSEDSEGADPRDHSTWWRPAVEEHEQNHEFTHKELLVPVIRDLAESIIAKNANNFPLIVSKLESYRWDIFLRLQIHLCRLHPAITPERVRTLLLDPKLFFDQRVLHEWYLLLRDQFKVLPAADQKRILTRIEEEFDEERAIKSFAEFEGKQPESEQVARWRQYAHRDKLSAIASDLPPDWQTYYQSLIRELGQPEHPDFVSWAGSVDSGSKSPKTVDELAGMPFPDLFNFLLGFTPSPKPTSLELEALAGALELTSKKAPERFDVDLTCFTQLRPMFARSLIRGLTEAAVENRAVPLQRLFILYSAIASWTATAVKPEQLWEDNLDGLQLEVARSLRKLLSHDPPILKLEWRDSVWEIARSLTTARNPTVDYERRYSNGRKFATLSLNTTRGEAMHTLFSYATWVRRLTEGVQQQQNPAPEILEVLDRRLDPAIEPTMTIRAVYGEKLGWLFHFHEEWVRANLSRIFPKDSELAELKRVAWDTFVTFSNPSITLYDLLKTEYQDAVAKVGDDNSSDDQHDLGPPEEALSHHLLALYWWGALSIEGPTSLLAKFFQLAPVKLRAHAIDYVGRALKNTKTVPPYIIAHLQKLFDWRLGIAGQSADNSKHEAELAAFGSWVWSGKFDATWLLSRLQEVLMKIRELTRYGMYILEELSELSEKYPLETVRCLELIVTKEPQHLGWHAKPETVRNILKTAQESSSTAAREIASRTEDQLLRRGAFEYMTVESAAK